MNLTIKQSLITITIAMTVLLMGFLGHEASLTLQDYRAAGEIMVSDLSVAKAMDVANALADERSLGYIALLRPSNNDRHLKEINEKRDAVKKAYDAFATDIQINEFEGKKESLDDLNKNLQAIETLHSQIDSNITKPTALRDTALEKQWLDAMNKMITSISDTRIRMSKTAIELDGKYEAEILGRHFAWTFTEYLGRERARLTGLIESGRSISNDQNVTLAKNNGHAEEAISFIKKMAADGTAETLTARNAMLDLYSGEYAELRKKILDAGVTGKPYPLSAEQYYAAASKVMDAGLAFRKQLRHESDAYADNKESQAVTLIIIKTVLTLISLSLAIASFYVVIRQVTTPISTITARMGSLSEGKLETEVPYTAMKNEVGVMAAALQTFKESLIKNREMEAAEAAARIAREKRAELITKLTTTFDADASSVISAVSGATTELNATAESMSATAEETNVQASTVAAAANETSTNVQTVAAAAEELSASISEINRQVSVSARMSNEAVTVASKTNEQVQGLADASKKIGEVVSLINDIAAQTNLLALNATIEAARAGDAGKGFAVVASEVKNLATQTAKATEHISEQIKTVQGATVEAVSAIQGIVTKISEISATSSAIAAAVEEQGSATQEILRNVQQAATGTNEVSANIEGVSLAARSTGTAAAEVLAATKELSQQSEKMRLKIETFLSDVRSA